MDFKNYLLLGIGAGIGSLLAFLIGNETEAKKIAAKGVSGLMIGLLIIPAFMKYFELPIEVWVAITGVSSVIGVEIIMLLAKKLKEYIDNKIKTN
jgi:uncharacterized membrane protein YfcA